MISKTQKKQINRIVGRRYGFTEDSVIVDIITRVEGARGDYQEYEVYFTHMHTNFKAKTSVWINTKDGRMAVHSY